eukprot:gene9518-biopygen7368
MGSAVWLRAALCAVWAAPCGAVRRHVPCGHCCAAPYGAMCRVGNAVGRRADAVRTMRRAATAVRRHLAPCAPCVPCGQRGAPHGKKR